MNVMITVFSPATGTWGSITRMVAMADAFLEAGHRILFCAGGPIARELSLRGYPLREVPAATMFGLPARISRHLEKRSARMSLPVKEGKAVGNIWFVLALSGYANRRYLKTLVESEEAAAADFKPEVLVTEMDPGAFVVSWLCGIPLAATYASVMAKGAGSFFYRLMNGALRRSFGKRGLRAADPLALLYGRSYLRLIPSIPSLEVVEVGKENTVFVGDLLSDFKKPTSPLSILADRKYVFVYMGTGSVALGIVERELRSFFASLPDYTCIVCSQSYKEAHIEGNLEFRPFVSASELLPHCAWTIAHGGHNTIIQSIKNGIPMLLFPGPIFERRFNADMVAREGAGLMGEISDFNAVWLREAFKQQERCKRNALRLAVEVRSLGGAASAVRAVERWTGTK